MTPAELRAIGRRLYGEDWQTPLARDLGVNPRTVRKWLAGARAISSVVALAVSSLQLPDAPPRLTLPARAPTVGRSRRR